MSSDGIKLIGPHTDERITFDDLHLRLQEGLVSVGIGQLTALQQTLISQHMTGRDVVCVSGSHQGSTMGSVIAILQKMLNRQWMRTTPKALLLFSDAKTACKVYDLLAKLVPWSGLLPQPLIEDSLLPARQNAPYLYPLIVATPQTLLPSIENGQIEPSWFDYVLFDRAAEILRSNDSEAQWQKFCGQLSHQNCIRILTSPTNVSLRILLLANRKRLHVEVRSPDIPNEVKLIRLNVQPGKIRPDVILAHINRFPRQEQLLIVLDGFDQTGFLLGHLKRNLPRDYPIGNTHDKTEEIKGAISSFTAGRTKVLIYDGGPLDGLNVHRISTVLFPRLPLSFDPIRNIVNYVKPVNGRILVLVDPKSDDQKRWGDIWREWQKEAITQNVTSNELSPLLDRKSLPSNRLLVRGLSTTWANWRVLGAMEKHEPLDIERRMTKMGEWEDYGTITFRSIEDATSCLEQHDGVVLGENAIEMWYAEDATGSTAEENGSKRKRVKTEE